MLLSVDREVDIRRLPRLAASRRHDDRVRSLRRWRHRPPGLRRDRPWIV